MLSVNWQPFCLGEISKYYGWRCSCSRTSPWWRHQMEIFSALLAICAWNSPVPVNSPYKGQWRGALIFSLISAWINGWVNNRKAGDLRRHRAHYDMWYCLSSIDGYLSPVRKNFNHRRHHILEKWEKCEYIFCFLKNNFSTSSVNSAQIHIGYFAILQPERSQVLEILSHER